MPTKLTDAGDGAEASSASLERSKRLGAATRVLEHVSDATRWAVTRCLRDGDLDDYRAFEAERMAVLAEKTESLLERTVLPFCCEYVRNRFPELRGSDFPRFDALEFFPEYQPSTDGEILSGFPERMRERLGSCVVEYRDGGPAVRIAVDLDALFQDFLRDGTDEEDFDDALVQVLAHEAMHAISTSFYLVGKEEREGEIRRLTVRESLGMSDSSPSWESLSTRLGFSCNFLASRSQDEATPFQTFPVVNAINEGLTDTFAARAYAAYRKAAGLPPKKYRFSYSDEARAFTYAMRSLAAATWADPNETFRKVEAGYFLGDEAFLEAFEDVILPSLEKFKEAME